MRGSDRTEKHFLHLVWSLKIEYKRLKHEPHGNKSVGANTVRPSKEQARNYNTVWQPKKICPPHLYGSDVISVSQKWASRYSSPIELTEIITTMSPRIIQHRRYQNHGVTPPNGTPRASSPTIMDTVDTHTSIEYIYPHPKIWFQTCNTPQLIVRYASETNFYPDRYCATLQKSHKWP